MCTVCGNSLSVFGVTFGKSRGLVLSQCDVFVYELIFGCGLDPFLATNKVTIHGFFVGNGYGMPHWVHIRMRFVHLVCVWGIGWVYG